MRPRNIRLKIHMQLHNLRLGLLRLRLLLMPAPMTYQARLDTLHFLCDVVMLVSLGVFGAASYDLKTRLDVVEPDAKFAQTFMEACLSGRTFVVSKDLNPTGVTCQTF